MDDFWQKKIMLTCMMVLSYQPIENNEVTTGMDFDSNVNAKSLFVLVEKYNVPFSTKIH